MTGSNDWLAHLHKFRLDNSLTQHDIAAFLGISQKTVSRWERGVDQPSAEIRDKLRLLLEGDRSQLPNVYEAVRKASVPLALIDDKGNVLVASPSYPGAAAEPERPAANRPVLAPTILIVEDDEAVLKATHAVLKRWQFLSVGANDGPSALALVEHGEVVPAAAIVDFLLPGPMDGVDVALALRQMLGEFPVLIVSGEATPERMRKIAASRLPFISKPVDPREIKLALASLTTSRPRLE